MNSTLFSVLAFVGIVAAAWYVVASLLIFEALRKRGVPVSFLLLRLFIIRYANQYKEATREESGKVGALYYHWLVSINVVLLVVVLLLILGLG